MSIVSILERKIEKKYFIYFLCVFNLKLNTFENIEAKSTAEELSDGVAMCQCLAAM